MTSYVVRNGRLVSRENDRNTPNYRLIPYNSTINAHTNEYFENCRKALEEELQSLRRDFDSLSYLFWKFLSLTDDVAYDCNVALRGLSREQMQQKVQSLRRVTLSANECDESLKLSAIARLDESMFENLEGSQLQGASQSERGVKKTLHNSHLITEKNLYKIEQEGEDPEEPLCKENIGLRHDCVHEAKKCGAQKNRAMPFKNNLKSNEFAEQGELSCSSQKKKRRSSLLTREKISIALNEQQQLRVILEEELERIDSELNSANEYLSWSVEQLQQRDLLIGDLKRNLLERDSLVNALNGAGDGVEIEAARKSEEQQVRDIEDRDCLIGELLGRLIEMSESAHEEVKYLVESTKQSEVDFPSDPSRSGASGAEERFVTVQQIDRSPGKQLDSSLSNGYNLEDLYLMSSPRSPKDQENPPPKPLSLTASPTALKQNSCNQEQRSAILSQSQLNSVQNGEKERPFAQGNVLLNVKMIQSVENEAPGK